MLPELVTFSSKCMYTFAECLHCIPFTYKSGKNEPDSIVPNGNMRFYIPFATYSVLFQAMLSVVIFEAAFFGQVETYEFFLIIGGISITMMMTLSELHFLLPFPRRRAVSLMNCVYETMFHNSYSPSPTFAFISLAFNYTAITYPLLMYPLFVFISFYMPGIFRGIHSSVELITDFIELTNVETTANFQILLRLFVLLIFTVAFGHGGVNLITLGLWALMYHATTVHSLELLLEWRGNS